MIEWNVCLTLQYNYNTMKITFHAEIVNRPFEDPVLYVRAIHSKRAMLFDLGSIESLDVGKINDVTEIFVTHMHIDHFIGFDTALRILLKRDIPLTIYGPEGIIDCIQGKLKGYTWNLIKFYPLLIKVFEIKETVVNEVQFKASEEFKRVDYEPRPFLNPIFQFDGYYVRAIILSHEIPVIAYSLEEDMHININKVVLNERSLPVGPWLSELKRAIRLGESDDYVFSVDNKKIRLGDIKDLVMITKGHKLCYVMDTSPTEENFDKLVPFIKDADILFCEAFFSDNERDRAYMRNHLTAKMAGHLARMAGVKNLKVMHFSQKYKSNPDLLYEEAEREYQKV